MKENWELCCLGFLKAVGLNSGSAGCFGYQLPEAPATIPNNLGISFKDQTQNFISDKPLPKRISKEVVMLVCLSILAKFKDREWGEKERIVWGGVGGGEREIWWHFKKAWEIYASVSFCGSRRRFCSMTALKEINLLKYHSTLPFSFSFFSSPTSLILQVRFKECFLGNNMAFPYSL